MSKIKNNPKAILPKGFKDSDIEILNLRKKVSKIIEKECLKYGFIELDTSTIEYTESIGKFLPDVDRPSGGVFSFQDDDEKWLSLRYDLTAPLARYVAQNYQDLVKPFKRYQSGLVWRNEKPGPGRYREFFQFDADVVGVDSTLIDAELCVMVCDILIDLGLNTSQFEIKFSNREIWTELFSNLDVKEDDLPKILRAVDKKDRLGIDGVNELLQKGRKDVSGDFMEGVGLSETDADKIISFITNSNQSNAQMEEFNSYIKNFPDYPIRFDSSVVRGLDYYTGMIFEAELLVDIKNEKGEKIVFGSVAGGGRYDRLISRFGKEDVPATGISIGVDRLIVALNQLDLLDNKKNPLVVIANLDNQNMPDYISMAKEIRNEGIACEISFGSKNLGKQLKYCDRKGADIVIIAGDEELKKGEISIKDLNKGKEVSKDIVDRDKWKEAKAGQQTINRSDLMTALNEILS